MHDDELTLQILLSNLKTKHDLLLYLAFPNVLSRVGELLSVDRCGSSKYI
jgi:hypothetical protein